MRITKLISEARDRDLNDLKIGDTAETSWTVTEQEISTFAKLSGDFNPLHVSKTFADTAGFNDCVAHGFLLGSKLSGLIGMQLPGKRCLLLEQSLAYPEPAYPGDTLNFKVTLKQINDSVRVIELKVKITKFDETTNREKIVARGTVICKILS